jgi:Sulfotransferase domain
MSVEQPTHSRSADVPRSFGDLRAFGYHAGAVDTVPADLALPPSFYVIGAPRCGSTAVSDTLKRNPRISFSVPKETHFLQKDWSGHSLDVWRRTYVARYHPRLGPQHQAMGDGSVSYIFSPDAIRRALEFDPRARFIAVLRNPVEMLQSYHLRLLYLLDEDVEDFATAWSLQESRTRGENIPKRCREPLLLQYGEIGRYGAHLQRVFEVAGRERCLVLLFEDLLQQPRQTYLRILDFIGVEDDGNAQFRRKRQSLSFRSWWLQRLLMNPPDWVLRGVQAMSIKQIPHLKRWRKKLKRINNRPAEHQPLSAETRAMLRRHFTPDIERLAQLLDRDLSHWLRAEDSSQRS